MPVRPRISIVLPAAVLAAAVLSGCGTVGDVTQGFAQRITPYRIDIVQGNFVSREQLEVIKPGMPKAQIRDILGTPLITSLFHADRWDYVFTLRRQGVEPQQRRLTLYFKGEALERYEGDPLPSESEFVATLNLRRKFGKAPELQASEDALKSFSGKPASTEPATTLITQQTPPAPVNYPPLER